MNLVKMDQNFDASPAVTTGMPQDPYFVPKHCDTDRNGQATGMDMFGVRCYCCLLLADAVVAVVVVVLPARHKRCSALVHRRPRPTKRIWLKSERFKPWLMPFFFGHFSTYMQIKGEPLRSN